ncbi:MAG: 2-hydroxyacyl-CoA dehydratase [Clostridiales bacterium]|nr:MAG: 2-hydroxyacyl-CoA dehydratase [Clostridiales bacterium]
MAEKLHTLYKRDEKKDYTILIPNMLPTHFKLIMSVLKTYGYKNRAFETSGTKISETGLKYTHNDTCYPAILVIGQFLSALLSGKYDTHKVALIMFSDRRGCRASNYIYLIRKALKKANLGYIPVISLFACRHRKKHPGFTLGPKMLKKICFTQRSTAIL